MSQDRGRDRPTHGWRRFSPAVLTLVLGTALSLGAYLAMRDREVEDARHAFERESSEIAAAVERRVELGVEAVQSIRGYYDSSREVERAEFHEFARDILRRRSEIETLAVVARVTGEERAGFEARARADGLGTYAISSMTGGAMVPRAEEAEYFPIFYLESLAPDPVGLGRDMRSEPVRRRALEAARDDDRPARKPAHR